MLSSLPLLNEPDSAGEIAYGYVLERLRTAGYQGYIGAEYKPHKNTVDGLAWISEYALQLH